MPPEVPSVRVPRGCINLKKRVTANQERYIAPRHYHRRRLNALAHGLQGGWGGWPTGNGKKLNSSQAQLARQHAWLLLNFFLFPVGHPPHPPCTLCAHFPTFLHQPASAANFGVSSRFCKRKYQVTLSKGVITPQK